MNTVFLILILLVGNSLKDNTLRESTDLIELNHHYDLRGEVIFDQIIFWERLPETGKFRVRAWTLTDYDNKNKRLALEINNSDNIYTVTYFDIDEKANRRITSRIFRESWTQKDPEREDKKIHGETARTGLITRRL